MTISSAHSGLLIELCAGGIDDVLLAAELQVDRIELNCGMALGGLTPSAGLVAAAREAFTGPIVAMVRPREAGFTYSEAEFNLMLADCDSLLAAGINGIAIGCLTSSGTIDAQRCAAIRRRCATTTLVFHKAFDGTSDLLLSARQLIDVGFDRILTSGGASTAVAGRQQIRTLVRDFSSQIEIVVGGGVRAENLEDIVRETGCDQIHSSVRRVVECPLSASDCDFGAIFHNGVVGFGIADRTQLQRLIQVARELT
ncbi:copper homeostasis protein CutC [Rubripirellula reticaptiva]|uniref:PF03932 family protein CutC n=1 Tax=Rubripirellula reticaptiva TaxID=2528013 RepID=A0A5C6F7T4_9BACT|nr:copper homeostasis protein CutC [Rubripirellula reticaptiva]TWU56146.1 Copper homeostasis protein CutC [Rubripirellula reticaptiva]